MTPRLKKSRLIEAHQAHWTSAWTWFGFLGAFGLGQVLMVWALTKGYWWAVVPLVAFLGHLMHAHLIAFHEAAHRTLCPNRRLNDVMGMFIGSLSFMGFSLYRAAHHTHHAFLSTTRDEELWPFVLPGTPRWLRRLAAVFELSVGLVFTPLLFLRTFLRSGSPIRNRAVRRHIWAELALLLGIWVVLLTATALLGAWEYFLFMYLLPALLAGNLQSLRKYIEHMGLTEATVLGSTRSVVPQGPLGKLLAFSLFNISYHGIHHQFGAMPQGAMPEFTSLLAPNTPTDQPPYPSYRTAMVHMLRSLPDPRVGAQWVGK